MPAAYAFILAGLTCLAAASVLRLFNGFITYIIRNPED